MVPAHAGMNRMTADKGVRIRCGPRTRGDEPYYTVTVDAPI